MLPYVTSTPILALILSLSESVLVGSILQMFGSVGVDSWRESCLRGADSDLQPPNRFSDQSEFIKHVGFFRLHSECNLV